MLHHRHACEVGFEHLIRCWLLTATRSSVNVKALHKCELELHLLFDTALGCCALRETALLAIQDSRVLTYDVRSIIVVWLSLMSGVQASVGISWIMVQILQQQRLGLGESLHATEIAARPIMKFETRPDHTRSIPEETSIISLALGKLALPACPLQKQS